MSWRFFSLPEWRFPIAAREANEPIRHDRLSDAQSLGRKIINATDERATIIDANPSINRDFAMPAGNWESETNGHLDNYQLLASLSPEEIQLLRFRSQNFSGNSLILMNEGAGTRGGSAVPVGFEKNWSFSRRREIIDHWFNLTKGVPSRFVLKLPNMMGEVGWWCRGKIVNIDANNYQERMTLLFRSGILETLREPRILEIGGGYGALALGLCNALNPSQYVICDLPESLLFSGLYLTIAQDNCVRLTALEDGLKPKRKGEICLLPNYLAEVLLPGERFDLVINTLSMSEMPPLQVKTYGKLISKAIGGAGFFFEQNQDNRHMGLIDCHEHLAPFFRKRERVEVQGLISTRAPRRSGRGSAR